MNIQLSIEVTESGLKAAEGEIAAFLGFEASRSGDLAALGYVVLRKLAIQITAAKVRIDRAQRDRPKPAKPTVRAMRAA